MAEMQVPHDISKGRMFDHEHTLAEKVGFYEGDATGMWGGSLVTCDRCDWTAALPVTPEVGQPSEIGKWELWHDGKLRASGWCLTCGDGSENRHVHPGLNAMPR